MNKLMLLLSAFRKGNELADSAKWKSRQITSTAIGAFIIALIQLAKALGYDIPLDSETATAIGAGILGVVNVALTILTSKRIGTAEQAGANLPEGPKATPVQDSPEANNGVAQAVDDSARWSENNN